MKVKELAATCMNALERTAGADAYIYVKMPPCKGHSDTRRLVPRGPVGRVVQTSDYDVVSFSAWDVLAWCVANSDGKVVLLSEPRQVENEKT